MHNASFQCNGVLLFPRFETNDECTKPLWNRIANTFHMWFTVQCHSKHPCELHCPAEPSCKYVNLSSRVPNVQIVNGVDSLFDHAECLETMFQICVRQRLAAFSCCSLWAIIRSCQGDLKKISSLVSLPCICRSASLHAIHILCRCSPDQRHLILLYIFLRIQASARRVYLIF